MDQRKSRSAPVSRSGYELVAAGLRHQDLRMRGIALDLLAQPVDMSLERMGGDAGIVAPDIVQQGVAADNLLACPIQELDDRGFLFGEPDFLRIVADQELGRRFERIRSDAEDGIFALLMLAQMRADAGQKHAE